MTFSILMHSEKIADIRRHTTKIKPAPGEEPMWPCLAVRSLAKRVARGTALCSVLCWCWAAHGTNVVAADVQAKHGMHAPRANMEVGQNQPSQSQHGHAYAVWLASVMSCPCCEPTPGLATRSEEPETLYSPPSMHYARAQRPLWPAK